MLYDLDEDFIYEEINKQAIELGEKPPAQINRPETPAVTAPPRKPHPQVSETSREDLLAKLGSQSRYGAIGTKTKAPPVITTLAQKESYRYGSMDLGPEFTAVFLMQGLTRSWKPEVGMDMSKCTATGMRAEELRPHKFWPNPPAARCNECPHNHKSVNRVDGLGFKCTFRPMFVVCGVNGSGSTDMVLFTPSTYCNANWARFVKECEGEGVPWPAHLIRVGLTQEITPSGSTRLVSTFRREALLSDSWLKVVVEANGAARDYLLDERNIIEYHRTA